MTAEHPLKAFREAQEPPLSQAELAAKLSVSHPTVHRWEAGVRQIDTGLIPRITELTGIPARLLRPDLAELLDDNNNNELQETSQPTS